MVRQHSGQFMSMLVHLCHCGLAMVLLIDSRSGHFGSRTGKLITAGSKILFLGLQAQFMAFRGEVRRDQRGVPIYEGQPYLPAPPPVPPGGFAPAAPVEANPWIQGGLNFAAAAREAAGAMNDDGLWGNWQPGHGRDPRAVQQAGQKGGGMMKGKGKGRGTRHQVRAGQDPTRFQLPRWCQRLIGHESTEDDAASALCVDTRDRRTISPWQGHFALEINDNADSALNVVTERAQMQSSSSGYLFQFCAILHAPALQAGSDGFYGLGHCCSLRGLGCRFSSGSRA